jgi:hypothetical protein
MIITIGCLSARARRWLASAGKLAGNNWPGATSTRSTTTAPETPGSSTVKG